jgi:hypothetical protein
MDAVILLFANFVVLHTCQTQSGHWRKIFDIERFRRESEGRFEEF